ncbi:Satratoxin biosynthesis SC1 cluster protein 4 [Colletotrichum orbiculare MAFF 240422]|uniref:Satratoxin biosynthesis SC1 cluster protein 4 n=1 Tax=Colletotrichum orbiculare (strain 104-T / ATCC 96160 / CBS 514.97 / LARS 414 / MAFF 240422) TaxID=1213857 RepID=A0A484FP36_COLOR|nr:Satratoxin biosynthesis SC1 cluster protein 4 [Colletotrichum orbiculare MAFF 240422]
MRFSALPAASCGGLLWLALVLSMTGLVEADGRTSRLVERRQLPDLSRISPCGLSCLVQGLNGAGCAPTNTTCSCASPELGQIAAACLVANCTMQDSLDLAQLQAAQCNLPHESQTTKLLAILVTVYIMAVIAIGLRLVAKNMAKNWSTDDVLIVGAVVIAVAPFSFVILMAVKGFGTHLYDLQPGALQEILRLLYAAEIVYVFVLLFAKLSLVAFYLRIFTVPRFRMAAWSLIGFLVVGQVVIGFLTIFSCHPIELFWDKNIHTGGCLDINQLAYANSALAILQDLIILALPIAMLPGLQMDRSKKISVATVFLLGSVGFISTVIRLQVLAVFGNSIDPTWDYVPVVWWTVVELGVVIVCACLPMIRNLVNKAFPDFSPLSWATPKAHKDSYGASSDKSYRLQRRQKLGRSHSPPQFSDNYVRDHLTSPSAKAGQASPPTVHRARAQPEPKPKPKVPEPPVSPPQPFDLSWRSANPYGIPTDDPYAVGKTNYNLEVQMLERKDRNFDEDEARSPLLGGHPIPPRRPRETMLLGVLDLLLLLLLLLTASTEAERRRDISAQVSIPEPPLTIGDGVTDATRAHWMRQAVLALPGPCPFAAFGSVIVNHTAGGAGQLVCSGANNGHGAGNPTLHGEMVAINNCSALFTGPYGMSPAEALAAFADLTLYTNAESCPMCASAVRWAGFREYVYGTSIARLVELGWGQIRIPSREVFERSAALRLQTRLVVPVLADETDGLFGWQFDPAASFGTHWSHLISSPPTHGRTEAR